MLERLKLGAGRRDPTYIIGVDESGTGALAGPFTVTAFMSHVADAALLSSLGARDSKTLTRAKRIRLCDELAPAATISQTVFVPHDYIDQREAWRNAVIEAVVHCLQVSPDDPGALAVIIDGSPDAYLSTTLQARYRLNTTFAVHGDQLIPQISAASIFAKTSRTERMAELHEQYPVYGWSREGGRGNDGYGTKDHFAAIQKHGICPLHRRVRPLLPYFHEREAKEARVHE